jgi:xanthine dehydrogenase accessory factor
VIPDLAARAAELRAGRVPFVHARVVLAERPTSARPGDEALVLADGTIEGFVGGTCAEASVRSQALALLDSGRTTVLRITPRPEDAHPGKVVVHNPCLSGGSLEVYLEASVPPPLVLVAGNAPIARALRTLGAALGYEVRAHDGTIPADTSAIVVASHGRDETAVLAAALDAGVPYVGLVASPRRGKAVVDELAGPQHLTSRIRTPAGLDIGATTPEEVALSILAEIVSSRPRPSGRPPAGDTASPGGGLDATARPAATAVDPVCGMTVAIADASLHLDTDGVRSWFCGTGCLRAFAADPSAYPRSGSADPRPT